MARVKKSVRLDPEATRGWDRWCSRTSVSFTGIVEAMGEMLHEDEWEPDDQLVQRARQIDWDRGSRR